ncbi:MAG TPA: pseudaminic acid synthase [Candidatus Taylorbacteria bacterium]|nr:MAG: Pseudaminic acid synthase [Parcubacteria group bacterium GW2011_GWA2_47_64]KKU96673.1 MAG: Pseudaminic acid synthase [Parcubacteria group bacterium GW2011_GWC2_48_17]HBV00764.1 pseudaminic acid synthase [Candidatus Taylorbacteria bacterium]
MPPPLAVVVDCMHIGNKKIGPGYPCFIVAELSGNHRGSFEEAVRLVKAAKEAGADAVKLQTYTEDTMTLNSDREWFIVEGKDNPEIWKHRTLYDLYTKGKTPWEWQPKLKALADELGIILFSSPFDETAVDFLEKMRVPCYKISAYEATDFVLLRKIAQTRKPVIISFGYSSEEEIQFALHTLKGFGAKDIVALHCVTGYSDSPRLADMHLSNIEDLRKRFGVVAGFSDNNAGIEIPLMAVASGASVIEKHFILNRSKGGQDAKFSLEPRELKELISRIRALETGTEIVSVPKDALGTPHYGPTNELEAYNKRWRRSLFSGADIKKGEVFTERNVRDVRPAFGLETKYYDEVIGKRATCDISFATPLSWEMIELTE